MTPKDLYRAIGDIDDEHLIIKKRRTFSDDGDTAEVLTDGENTIDIGVVRKKKILPHLIAAVLVLAVGAAAAAVACSSLKKDRERERKTIGYFKEDETFDPVISKPEIFTSDGENIYLSGWNTERESWRFLCFYDFEKGEETFVKFEDRDDRGLMPVAVTKDAIWSDVVDRDYRCELVRSDRSTGEVNGKIIFPDNEGVYEIHDREDGGYLMGKYTMDSEYEFAGYSIQLYDENLDLVSEKKIIDSEIIINEGYEISGLSTLKDGNTIVFLRDEDKRSIVRTYSPEGEVLSVVSLSSQKSDCYLSGVVLCSDGSLVLDYYKGYGSSDSETFAINGYSEIFEKMDPETGQITAEYEFVPDEGANMGFFNVSESSTPDYDAIDFIYPYVYGVNVSEGEKTLIADLSECRYLNDYTFNIRLSGEGLLYTAEEYAGDDQHLVMYEETDESFGKRCLMKTDIKGTETGCIITESDLGMGERTYIKHIRTADNGDLQLLVASAEEEAPGETYEYFYYMVVDSDLNIKKKVCLGKDVYSYEFIADDNERILLYDRLTHDLVFSDAAFGGSEEIHTAGNLPEAFFFKSGSDCYCLAPSSEDGKTVVYKVDFENRTITEVNTLDFVVKEAEDGDESYDAYFILENGVKGYKLNDRSCDDIVDWIDSGVTATVKDVAVIDKDTLLVRTSEGTGTELKSEIKLFRRAGDKMVD